MSVYDLKIGFRCNNNCAHCVVADKRFAQDASFEDLKRLISTVPEEYAIQITGGEPTIYSYLPDLLKYCHELGHRTTLQTNGTGFSDLSFTKACAPYLNHVHIAIHSCYPEVHDRIVNSQGMWAKTIQGLDNLIAENIFFTSQTVLSKYNIESLYDTFSFIQQKKPGTVMSMTYPHLMGNAWSNYKDVAFRYSDYKHIISKCLETYHSVLFTESIPCCYLHPYATEVETLEKDILFNVSRIGYDLAEPDRCKDYNFLNLQDHRKGPRCKECIYDKYCIGVWKEYIEIFKNCLDLYPVVIREEDGE